MFVFCRGQEKLHTGSFFWFCVCFVCKCHAMSAKGWQFQFSGLCLFFFFFNLAMLDLSFSTQDLSCSMWGLVPQPGIEPWPPALGAQSLNHWTTKEVTGLYLKRIQWINRWSRSKIQLHGRMGLTLFSASRSYQNPVNVFHSIITLFCCTFTSIFNIFLLQWFYHD